MFRRGFITVYERSMPGMPGILDNDARERILPPRGSGRGKSALSRIELQFCRSLTMVCTELRPE